MRRSSPWVLLCGLGICTGCAARAPDPRAPAVAPAAVAVAARQGKEVPLPASAGAPTRLVELARRHPELADLSLYLAGQAAAARGDTRGVADAAATIDARWPDSVWRGPAMLLDARVRRRTGDLAGARDAARAASEALPSGPRRALAEMLLAEVTADLGDTPGAIAIAQEVRAARPRGLAAQRARRLVDRLRDGGQAEDPAERLADTELRLGEGDAGGALREATAILQETSLRAQRDQARWVQTRAQRALGHSDAAEATALALAADGGPTYAPKALATVARWKWNVDDDAAAARLFAELVQRWPQSEEAPEALYALGRIRQEAGDHEGAFSAYMTLADRFPLARTADEARWRAGWVRYLAGDAAAAATVFASLAIDCDRRTRVAAEYWEARALEHLGAPNAVAKFQHIAEQHAATYYGALARARLGTASAAVDIQALEAARPPFPEGLAGLHATRARILHEAGFDRLARLELEAIGDAAPAELLLLAYTAVEAPGSAIRLARTRDTERHWLYPLGFWDLVRAQAEVRSLDPLLVTALIRQESLFFPDAVSPAHAHGLMQLLPRTAREVAPAAGVPAPDAEALHRPGTNVALGTTLLRRLLDRYGGSRVKALAAYNAGEEAVAKWERRYGDRPEDEFVELITYRETRDYVKAVLEHYEVYRTIYAARPSATSAGSPPKAPFDMITMTSPARAEASR